MQLELGASDLHGLILSQSRVLHYEATLTDTERQGFRGALLEKLRTELPAPRQFDFALTSGEFSIRP
jgi:hypothetical protein